jgi:invasion protein IalB
MRALMLCLTAALFSFGMPAQAAGNPDAKLLKVDRFGEWDVWCVKRHVEPQPDCFVVNSIVYSPRPNFAALVLYFRPPGFGKAETRVRLGMEAQSALAPGYIKVDGESILGSTQCLLPGSCSLTGARADDLIRHFSEGGQADWRHYDYGVDPVDIALDLSGFAEAYEQARVWTKELE